MEVITACRCPVIIRKAGICYVPLSQVGNNNKAWLSPGFDLSELYCIVLATGPFPTKAVSLKKEAQLWRNSDGSCICFNRSLILLGRDQTHLCLPISTVTII